MRFSLLCVLATLLLALIMAAWTPAGRRAASAPEAAHAAVAAAVQT